jgi:predicted metallopeptidase
MQANNQPMPELEGYIKRIMEAFPKEMGHVKPSRILTTSFSKKSSKAAAKVGPIPGRFASFFPEYDYFVEVHKEAWEVADEAKKLYIVLHELTHIPEEGFLNSSTQYRKVLKHDVEDFSHLMLKYGVELEKVDELAKKVR